MTADNQVTFFESDADGSLPRHFLRSALFIGLLPSRSHGYELLEQVKLFGLSSVDLAGVYRAMKLMEHEGLVSSEWEKSELGPPRRVYELTSLGQVAADEHRQALCTARDHLDHMIRSVSPTLADLKVDDDQMMRASTWPRFSGQGAP
jgi:DNA-binding PadR family transcriptional regulator